MNDVVLHAYITFFWDAACIASSEARLGQLAEVVWHLAQIPCAEVRLRIVTNAEPILLDGVAEPVRARTDARSEVQVHKVSLSELDHPYDLTWSHKQVLADDVSDSPDSSYFLYIEDDEVFTAANLRYFIDNLDSALACDAIPSFHRCEWHPGLRRWVVVDAESPVPSLASAAVNPSTTGAVLWVPMPNPYSGMFLLDKRLACEYVASASFDRDASATRIHWEVRERAAMGLAFERVRKGRVSRTAVAFSADTHVPLPGSAIRHLGDKYSNAGGSFGSIPLHGLEGAEDSGKPPRSGIASRMSRLLGR